jgi:hypothetical protein
MSKKFLYRCKPRTRAHHAEASLNTAEHGCQLGGGSGGGPVSIDEVDVVPAEGGQSHYFDGTYSIAANRVEITSRPPIPPAVPGDFIVSLFAGGLGVDGRVEINGSQGVRLTAGPPQLPPATSESTNGAEIIVGELQSITLQRGLIPAVDQQIVMAPESILIDGGVGTVTIQSMTEVKLQVAEGLSSITLTPAGIIIQGLLVSIN